MKEYKQLGAYGILVENEKILLIKKVSGPYDGKLDLPGGTIEFGERPYVSLSRELIEEVGIKVADYQLFDVDSVFFDWQYNENELIKVHHTGVFYKILTYENDIKKNIEIDSVNDDSLGAEFYEISKLTKNDLSAIAVMVLEKLGYSIEK